MTNKKINKVPFIVIILILFSIAIVCGVWIIANDTFANPPDIPESTIVTKYINSTTPEYDHGNILLPSKEYFGLDVTKIKYEYRTDTNSEWIICEENIVGPQNAGDYYLRVTFTNNDNSTSIYGNDNDLIFKILPKTMTKDNTIVTVNQNGKYYYSGNEVQATVKDVTVMYDDGVSCKLVFNTDYSLDSTTPYLNNINVGDAKVQIEGKGNYTGNATGDFIIVKQLFIDEVSIDFLTCKEWNSFKSDIDTALKEVNNNKSKCFKDITGNYIDSTELNQFNQTVNGIQDGTLGYGTNNETDILSNSSEIKYVAGSTYKINLTISGSKYYELAPTSKNLLKYKTVLIGKKLYTIEDALKTGGEILLKGDSSNTLFTNFSNLFNFASYTLKNGSKLYITYNGSTTLHSNTGAENKIYSVLYIPYDITLNVQGEINICARITSNSQEVYGRGVLFNNGNINVTNGASLNSYGYLNGGGTITAESNSTITDMMRFYNYTSGGPTLSMSNAKIFPLTVYSFHNISCDLKLYSGSLFQVFYDINLATVSMSDNLSLIGKGGLFELQSGYLIKSVEDTTTDFYYNNNIDVRSNILNYGLTNQDKTQKDVLNIYGQFVDNVISITKKVGKIELGIKTGKDYAMPIGFMHINLKKDDKGNYGNGILKSNSYKFFPGSKLELDSGTTLTIDNGVNIIFYDDYLDTENISIPNGIVQYQSHHNSWYEKKETITDFGAQLTVNGTLNVKGNVGGNIKCTQNTGILILSNNQATLLKMTKLKYTENDKVSVALGRTTASTTNETVSLTGNIQIDNATIKNQTFNVETYYSNGTAWYATSLTISYDSNGGSSLSDDIQNDIGPKGYTLSTESLKTPNKQGYSFDEWYLDSSLTTKADGQTIYASCTLYAKWNIINYNIEYIYKYDGCESSGTVINNTIVNNYSTDNLHYNIESNFYLADPIDGNLKFDGWYRTFSETDGNMSFSEPISQIQNMTEDLVLYAKFIDSAVEMYTITFVTNDEQITIPSKSIKKSEVDNFNINEQIDMITNYNNNESFSSYFLGWYLDENCTQEFTTLKQSCTVYAKWADKIELFTDYGVGYQSSEKWYYYGQTFNAPSTSDVTVSTTQRCDGFAAVSGCTLSNSIFTVSNDATELKISAIIKDLYNINISAALSTINYWVNGLPTNGYSETRQYIAAEGDKIKINISFKDNTENLYYNITGLASPISGNTKYNNTIDMPANDLTITATADEKSSGGTCLAEGTLINISYSETKPIQSLREGDKVLSINHLTGRIETSKIIIVVRTYSFNNINTLYFDNGISVKTINEHGLFDKELNKYVNISHLNYKDYLNHSFVTIDKNGINYTKLIDFKHEEQYGYKYDIVTQSNLNYFVENLLSVTHVLVNIINTFDFSDNLTYNKVRMNMDINTYGLYQYDEWKWIISEQGFNDYNIPIMKIGVSKGLYTKEYIEYLIVRFVNNKDSQI